MERSNSVPNVSAGKQAVLNALDEQIGELESQLDEYRPLLDELAQLKRARATLLGERIPVGRRGTLDAATLAGIMEASKEPLTPVEIAEQLGADANTVRSHLNRNLGTRYRKEGRGWIQIGEADGTSATT